MTKKIKEVAQNEINKKNNNLKKRFFKLLFNNETAGRFCGNKPKQAANKALTSIINKLKGGNKNDEAEFQFSIIECTRGSKHKEYKYIGKRVKLPAPIKVQIGGADNKKEIIYQYNTQIKKLKN